MTVDQFIKQLNLKPTHSTKWIKECLATLELGEHSKTIQNNPELCKNNFPETNPKYPTIKIDSIRKHDIIYMPTFGSKHYILVHRVHNNTVYGLILTSREECFTIMPMENDRKFKGSFVTNSYHCYPLSDCLDKFVGVYEDKREANKAFKIVKDYFKSIFK